MIEKIFLVLIGHDFGAITEKDDAARADAEAAGSVVLL
jgi:hypothetical protein